MRQIHATGPQGTPPATPLRFLFVRLTWAVIGPGVLLATTFLILEAGSGWATVLDFLFFAALAAALAARWWDFYRGDRTTSTGEIATLHDIRKYTVILVVVSLLAWVAANALGNHLLHYE